MLKTGVGVVCEDSPRVRRVARFVLLRLLLYGMGIALLFHRGGGGRSGM